MKNYDTVKTHLEKNPKATRNEVMKIASCSSLQAAAWMQRYQAEMHFSKNPGEKFKGRYEGSKPKPVNKAPIKQTVKARPRYQAKKGSS